MPKTLSCGSHTYALEATPIFSIEKPEDAEARLKFLDIARNHRLNQNLDTGST